MKTKSTMLLLALLSCVLSFAQNANDSSTLTEMDFGMASISKDIKSASINGQTYYYVVVKDKPNLAVIVEKKNAYKKFKEVILPEKFQSIDGQELIVSGIGNKAFKKCGKIHKVDLPKTVSIIGDEAFGSTDVDDLTLREGLKRIGSKAFFQNDLKDIHIPDGVEQIGEEAFYCLKGTIFQRAGSGTLYIPKSVYNIADHAFAMTRNGYGVWFNSRRDILCLPDYVNLDNCKQMGISRDPVEAYLKKNK